MANWLSKLMEDIFGPDKDSLRAKSVTLSEAAALLYLDTADVQKIGAQGKLKLIDLDDEIRVTKSSLGPYYYANQEAINQRMSEHGRAEERKREQKMRQEELLEAAARAASGFFQVELKRGHAEWVEQERQAERKRVLEPLLTRIFVHPEIGDAQFFAPADRKNALQRLLKRNPQDAQAHLELGVCLVINSADYRLLLPETHKDVEMHEDMWGTRYYVGKPLGGMISGEFLSSVSLGLNTALLSGIAHFYYGVAVGDITVEDTAMKEAVRQFRRWLRSNPHDLDALRFLVVAYTRLGKNADAEKTRLEIAKAEQLQKLGVLPTQRKSGKKQASSTQAKGIAFEELCLSLVRAMGFSATTTSVTADGGIDIVATSTQPLLSGKYIIQCKDWSNTIGEPIVRDLYGVVHAENANKGILIATSKFTKAAQRFAEGKPLELIDGEQFDDLLRQHKIKNEK